LGNKWLYAAGDMQVLAVYDHAVTSVKKELMKGNPGEGHAAPSWSSARGLDPGK